MAQAWTTSFARFTRPPAGSAGSAIKAGEHWRAQPPAGQQRDRRGRDISLRNHSHEFQKPAQLCADARFEGGQDAGWMLAHEAVGSKRRGYWCTSPRDASWHVTLPCA
eukprot:6111419-Prymnesium_polylepis.1